MISSWSWPQLVSAHHDYIPAASEEILRRLEAALPAQLDPLVRTEVESRWRVGLELTFLAESARDDFTMHRLVEPTTGREGQRLVVIDWAQLIAGDVDTYVKSAVKQATKRRFQLDDVDDRTVDKPSDAPEPDLWPGAEHARPMFLMDYCDPRIADVLVVYNGWNRKRRPDDPDEKAKAIAVDKRRKLLEPLASGIRAADGRLGRIQTAQQLHQAIQADADLRCEQLALARAMARLMVELERRKPRRVLSDEGAPRTARTNKLVAVWMVRMALQALFPERYAGSDEGRYAPTGLRPDTNDTLEAWGYSSPDKVLREVSSKRRYTEMSDTIRASLRPDRLTSNQESTS